MKASDLSPPICVDLDGTLIKTDLLIESFFALLGKNPLRALLTPFWLLKGRAHLKRRIAERVDLDVASLPYHEEFLNYLREQRAAGRVLLLVTAAHRKYAEQIANHLGLFSKVFATDEENLSGKRKLNCLLREFDGQSFVYAADARVDISIWSHCRQAVLVNPKAGVTNAARKVAHVDRVFDDKSGGVAAYARAMRLHQWLKNLLIFIPLFASHQIQNGALLTQSVIAFLAFGLCASSVYLLNDLFDLALDRRHPRKRSRPFASGTLPVSRGAVLAPLLLAAAFLLAALLLPGIFVLVLFTYYATTLAYSMRLKQIVLVDVMTLAGLYTLRVIAGAAAIETAPSFWLLAFSIFIFLSLALVKRYSEILVSKDKGEVAIGGRGYSVDDFFVLLTMGAASGYLAVLVLALYINSPEIGALYGFPQAIWLICPLLLFWISRVWLRTHRGQMHDDPVVFAVRDRISLIIGALCVVCVWAAT